MEEQFSFSDKIKRPLLMMMGVGALTLVLGFIFMDATRVWASILYNNMFFFGLGLIGVFFVAINYMADSGWYVMIKRIPEAMGSYLYVAFGVMLLVAIGAALHWHHIYHWTDHKLFEKGTEHYDKIIAGKEAYLNIPFFLIRLLIYFVGWIGLYFMIRKFSLQEDISADTKWHKKSALFSTIFIVFFAVTSSTSSWDWLMSIDTHWYSTLFGWYTFSSMFVSGLATITLIVLWLHKLGYLKELKVGHIHDLGKYVFAFTIFWTYLWFSQFMLIWYANIPEETIYFKTRMDHYGIWFWINLIFNFFAPFLILMHRQAKRDIMALTAAGIFILIGHWVDFYLMVYPGVASNIPMEVVQEASGHAVHSTGEHGHDIAHHAINTWQLGWLEIGTCIGFAGVFLFMVLSSLSKASLVPKNHPYLEESLHHSTL